MTRLVVDLSNKSAQVVHDGRAVLMWSGVTRRSAAERARRAGWAVDGEWEVTTPPDGFSCPVRPCVAEALAALEADMATLWETAKQTAPNSHTAHRDLELAMEAFEVAVWRTRQALDGGDSPWKVRHS